MLVGVVICMRASKLRRLVQRTKSLAEERLEMQVDIHSERYLEKQLLVPLDLGLLVVVRNHQFPKLYA
jgi:hypothetical protein